MTTLSHYTMGQVPQALLQLEFLHELKYVYVCEGGGGGLALMGSNTKNFLKPILAQPHRVHKWMAL